MVRITEDLVRKRAEHNNCELSTLEEVSLHQLDIESIEVLDKVCRELRILYLQSNLIPKIENVGRLKKLEYLNLALNNVTKIENLKGCESLTKLDLTVNFIGELSSIETLKENCFLRELFLTGNPCAQFTGYREYVITTLPQLHTLDGKEIEKSERILAKQEYERIKKSIMEQEQQYMKDIKQKDIDKNNDKNTQPGFDGNWYTDIDNAHLNGNEKQDKEENERRFWQEPVEYTPESRIAVHKHLEEKRKEKEGSNNANKTVAKEVRFFAQDGRPLNMNHGKYLDTSLIDVDLQPTYVRITVKGKIMQLAFQEEINPDSSTAKRSQVSGHLLLTMPKMKEIVSRPKKTTVIAKDTIPEISSSKGSQKLEVDPSVLKEVDFGNIVAPTRSEMDIKTKEKVTPGEDRDDGDFVDDPDVPPLI